MALGNNIKEKRQSLKLSQEYVAEHVGVSRQAVSKWERNQLEPSTNNLLVLARLLETDVETLIDGEMESDEQDESNKNIWMQIAACFGRVFMLVGFAGYMNVDPTEFGAMPVVYPYIWWVLMFLIGVVLTFIGSWDYFNRKAGTRKVMIFDFLFVLSIYVYELVPFSDGMKMLITLVYGLIMISLTNIIFFIPVWRKSGNMKGKSY